jgi:hypothetical protein
MLDRLAIVYGPATVCQPLADAVKLLSSAPEIVDQDPGLPGR